MTQGFTLDRDHCICCGMPRLSDNDIKMMLALYAASKPLCYWDLARVTETNEKVPQRAVDKHPGLFMRTEARAQNRKTVYLSLSPRGVIVASMLTGGAKELEGAAE